MTNVFTNTLEELQGGATAIELHEKLKELIGAVRATGRKGQLQLVLTVKPGQGTGTMQILVEDVVTTKLPKVGRDVSVFFADDENRLSRNDPRQPKLWPVAAPSAAPIPAPAETVSVNGVTVNRVTGELAE